MTTQKMRRSRVFIVRTWLEERDHDNAELRGMMREIESGETRYFRTWEEVVAFLEMHSVALERRKCQTNDGGLWNA